MDQRAMPRSRQLVTLQRLRVNQGKLLVEFMKTDIWVTVNWPSPGIELHDVVRRRMPFRPFQFLAEMLCIDEELLGKHMGCRR